MSILLCTREDLTENVVPLNVTYMDEAECQPIVTLVHKFFKSFLDTTPYQEAGVLSVRAENVLRRYHAQTLGDVRRLLVQALSNQGVFGAGRMVQEEWAGLLR
jgi:hypothetical protein